MGEVIPYYAHKEYIRKRLSEPLPGEKAHHTMMAYRRDSPAVAIRKDPPPRWSAVVMLIFPEDGQWCTAFIVRPTYDGAHSGQIAFPGGKMDDNDADLQATALRELKEELGIDGHEVEILGHLSDIYIPPSHFMVRPFVASLSSAPEFTPDKREVEAILREPLEPYFETVPISTTRIYIPTFNAHIQAPYFDIQGKILWGATAMMFQEFRVAMNPALFSSIP